MSKFDIFHKVNFFNISDSRFISFYSSNFTHQTLSKYLGNNPSVKELSTDNLGTIVGNPVCR